MDFIIPWVDENDPKWGKEFKKFKRIKSGDTDFTRFRDWENLRYWFRGVEKFAPWVNKIHFVTYGHLPQWLNSKHPKLNIIKHEDYIPQKYLPTFNTRTIELNFHRIKELDNKYVYFNDDIFILDYLKKDYFFKNNKPCDMAISVLHEFQWYQHDYLLLNDLAVINKHFLKKYKAYLKKPLKWINWNYGLKGNYKNIAFFMASPKFHTGFRDFHLAQPHTKRTLEVLWQKEYDIMDRTCSNTFRSNEDVNQYLQRYWNLASNNFTPTNFGRLGKVFPFRKKDDLNEPIEYIRKQKKPLICLNDSDQIENFPELKKKIIAAFQTVFPLKSDFEI